MLKKGLFVLFIFFYFIFIFSHAAILAASSPQFRLVYVIQEGETLYDIAHDYNISLNQLVNENDLNENNTTIRPGQELIIPLLEEPESKAEDKYNWDLALYEDPDNKNERADREFSLNTNSTTYAVRVNEGKILPEVDIPDSQIILYNVQRGDTLYDLARLFNTSTGVIMALNEKEDNIIRPGEQIKLPVHNLSEREVLYRTISDRELELLARIIHGEARGEPFAGKIGVGAVVINRLLCSDFPDSIEEVIFQSGQFSAVFDGQFNLIPDQSSYTAAREALRGKDPTGGALYFYNPQKAQNRQWFEDTREIITIIGDHHFAR